jgi:hypothetical protein
MSRLCPIQLTMLLAALVACEAEETTAPVPAATSEIDLAVSRSTLRQVIPVELSVFNVCYKGGPPEYVDFTGNAIFTQQRLSNPTSRLLDHEHLRWENVRGVGRTSGIQYHAIMNNNLTLHVNPDGSRTGTAAGTFLTVGREPAGIFVGHFNFRVVFAPDGTVQFFMDHIVSGCR